ncbi:hypothetical protein GOBAR_AA01144 [Gossypium barbadense]|uniref:VPS37 C-terminal domain-containing protein n=1 Tax=Gossypium barbadense TaxID=3634 RepID=A0A2P5YV21_GOSBA|nr:hypothetical protein GOBAR_AA01144 [Gossypium barbadense]
MPNEKIAFLNAVKPLKGSQEQQAQPRPQEGSSHSWYPPPGVSSTNSSRPSTPGSSASNSFNLQRPSERPHSPSQVSPSEAAGIIALLKDKSVDELRKLLSDKDAYNQFLLSVDQVKIQNNIRDELRKETLQLARNNLDKEPQIMELRNQAMNETDKESEMVNRQLLEKEIDLGTFVQNCLLCRIIWTTELAAALEKLNDLERQKEEILKFYSPASFINRLQGKC